MGLAIAPASRILSRVPLPIRSGTTQTVAFAISSRMSATVPVNSRPSIPANRRRNDSAGLRPATRKRADGTRRRSHGRISAAKNSTASRFGCQSMPPWKSTVAGSAPSRGAQWSVSTTLGTATTCAVGASSRKRALSSSEHARTALAFWSAARSQRSTLRASSAP